LEVERRYSSTSILTPSWAITPPPIKTTSPGSVRSDSTSSDVIIRSAPGIGRSRGFEPVVMTMLSASRIVPPTSTLFGPTNFASP